ncbi:class I SAM-dependent methyltransferase [Streptomyces iconiensis]|uniref:Methyltransferase domain-containing protein n=1 Tax=Streptomyces iconiensis TaxID=1384038 RepID=A0ABT7A7J8_9ACTN|nr:methyltransferase domain-containing protein [Streptomyces iconiensis]MDJ1137052.1 methyltransferase domain-containing protein [Streptomyces iconiensis]
MTYADAPLTFENEEFWTEFHDFLFPPERHQHARQLLDSSPLFAFPPGTRILDMCCGAGVFTAPLAARGHRVTGVDRSPAMLDMAAARCREAEATARLVRAEAAHFDEPAAYDIALNLYTSFGYAEDPAENAAALRAMRRALVPGGSLLLDLAGKEILARRVRTSKVVRRGEALVVQTDTALDDWSRMRSDWILVRGERARRACLEWYVYSAVELRGLLEEAGFAKVEVFGGFDATPYDAHAERLVLRATAPPAGA